MKKLFLSLLVVMALSLAVCACSSGDDESSADLAGIWYGTRSYYNPAAGTKYQYLTVTLDADKTGSLEYEGPNSLMMAYFKWKKSGDYVECNGVSGNSNGEASTDFSMKMKISGDRLIPVDRFNLFILTRDNSVMTDGNGNEIAKDSSQDDASEDSGSSQGGNSGGNSAGNESKDYKSILLKGVNWSTKDGKKFFTFYDNTSIAYVEQSSKTLGSWGFINLDARGSFYVSGKIINANYNDVSWQSSSNATDYFPGWIAGQARSISYTIDYISEDYLILKGDSKTFYLHPLF